MVVIIRIKMIIIVAVILITITIIISAVMDWELVCERKELRATAQAIFMTGVNNFNFLIIITRPKPPCGRQGLAG